MGEKVISEVYADFIAGIDYEGLPHDVIARAKERILDTIGVSLAGYASMEFPRLVVDWTASMGGAPEATMLRTAGKFPAVNVALANGACAHAIDMDDGHRFAALHPGVVVVPAAVAAAEMAGQTTKRLLAGVVAGYEVMIRVGAAINPSSLKRGFHATGVAGVFGAVSAAASIIGLNREQTVGALGMAGLQASGLLQVNHDDEGSKVKSLNPARAAYSGLLSCILAKKGARGPLAIFEGESGFLKAVCDEVKGDGLTRGLGSIFEISNVYHKFYAACRHAHAAIDAAMAAAGEIPIDPSEVERIRVETYPAVIDLAGIIEPKTVSATRFSTAFSVALALVRGDAGADRYSEENLWDEKIRSLARKVELTVGERWARAYPQERGATVTVYWKKGRVTSSLVPLAKGEPENPATTGDIYKKFLANAMLAVTGEHARRLADVIGNIESHPLDDFTGLL